MDAATTACTWLSHTSDLGVAKIVTARYRIAGRCRHHQVVAQLGCTTTCPEHVQGEGTFSIHRGHNEQAALPGQEHARGHAYPKFIEVPRGALNRRNVCGGGWQSQMTSVGPAGEPSHAIINATFIVLPGCW